MLTQDTFDLPARAKLTRFMAAAVVAGVVLATVPPLMTCGRSTLLEVAAATARQTHGVHLAILGVGTAIALGVCGAIFYSIGTFRAAGETESVALRRAIRETVWALVPVAILLGAAMPAVHAFVVADGPAGGQVLPATSHRCQTSPGS